MRRFQNICQLISYFFGAFFSFKKKVLLFSIPSHPNLGDQAQLMCTERWIKENFSNYKLFKFPHLCTPFANEKKIFNYLFLIYVVLKLTVRKNDIFIGHSGYFFVDHHGGWFSFDFLLRYWNNQFIVLPQTINFYAPVVKQRVATSFGNKKNLTILCRDNVSYENAKNLFGTTRLLLYPDIVTSLIGTQTYKSQKEGVLFCIRDDIEAFYSTKDIDNLMQRFGDVRKEKIATYKVVITDRYHGTIFSAIANTPVIVISSADHKLSSGVKWFPKEIFDNNVQYAENLDDAYMKAIVILNSSEKLQINPPYFKENYWDKLAEQINL